MPLWGVIRLLQLCVLSWPFRDGDVGIGVFPEGEEVCTVDLFEVADQNHIVGPAFFGEQQLLAVARP